MSAEDQSSFINANNPSAPPLPDLLNRAGQGLFHAVQQAGLEYEVAGQRESSGSGAINAQGAPDGRTRGNRIIDQIFGDRITRENLERANQTLINATNLLGIDDPRDLSISRGITAVADHVLKIYGHKFLSSDEKQLEEKHDEPSVMGSNDISGWGSSNIPSIVGGDSNDSSDTESWGSTLNFNGIDLNGDGRISRLELAISKHGNTIVDEMRKVDAISQMANKNFHRRTIQRRPVEFESTAKPTDQVNLVEQGMANYLESVNQFNVNF